MFAVGRGTHYVAVASDKFVGVWSDRHRAETSLPLYRRSPLTMLPPPWTNGRTSRTVRTAGTPTPRFCPPGPPPPPWGSTSGRCVAPLPTASCRQLSTPVGFGSPPTPSPATVP